MPGRSVEKYVVTAIGKLDGRTHTWVAGVFTDLKTAKPWVALLNVAHRANDTETVAAMDVHAPTNAAGERPTAVKYAGAAIQYSPDVPGLSDDTTLG